MRNKKRKNVGLSHEKISSMKHSSDKITTTTKTKIIDHKINMKVRVFTD